jgi:hypothetical protein
MCRWNSWNHFGCDINESLIRDTGIYFHYHYYDVLLFLQFIYVTVLNCIVLLNILADAMVSTGLAALGYKYINLGTQQLCLYYHAYSLFLFYKTIYIRHRVYLVFFFTE